MTNYIPQWNGRWLNAPPPAMQQTYKVGTLVIYQGFLYELLTPHTITAPDVSPDLSGDWALIGPYSESSSNGFSN